MIRQFPRPVIAGCSTCGSDVSLTQIVHLWTSCVVTSERSPLAMLMSAFESHAFWISCARTRVALWSQTSFSGAETKLGKTQNLSDAHIVFILLNKSEVGGAKRSIAQAPTGNPSPAPTLTPRTHDTTDQWRETIPPYSPKFNEKCSVVADASKRMCPVWVPGRLQSGPLWSKTLNKKKSMALDSKVHLKYKFI